MSANTFDSLTAARELEAAGIERTHAEAIAAQLRTAAIAAQLRTAAVPADFSELATKADLAVLRAELYRALWVQAAALIGAQVAIAGLIVALLGT